MLKMEVEVGGSWAAKRPIRGLSAILILPGFLAPSWFRIQEHSEVFFQYLFEVTCILCADPVTENP